MSDTPPRPAYGRLRGALFTAAVTYHCAAIFLILYQPAPALASARNTAATALHIEAYKQATHIRQRWDMFSRPRHNNDALLTEVIDREGKVHPLANNLFAEKRPVELTWERMRKFRLRITKRGGRGFRSFWAMYQCREWALRTGQAPREVVLYRGFSRIPSVSWVAQHGAYRAADLVPKRERLGRYPCRGDGLLPVYMKQRYGLPVNAQDQVRAAWVRRRLTQTFPRARKERQR